MQGLPPVSLFQNLLQELPPLRHLGLREHKPPREPQRLPRLVLWMPKGLQEGCRKPRPQQRPLAALPLVPRYLDHSMGNGKKGVRNVGEVSQKQGKSAKSKGNFFKICRSNP